MKKKHYFFAIIIVSTLLVICSGLIFSRGNDVKVLLNGQIQNYSSKALAFDDTVFLPLNELFSSNNYIVKQENNVIMCTRDNALIIFRPNESIVVKNGIVFDTGGSLILSNNNYMIALNLTGELLNADVDFNMQNKEVYLKDPSFSPYNWVKNNIFIAHALGGILGNTYTNSLDAFNYNYSNGFKLFETDLILTNDRKLVLRHEWSDSFNKQLEQDIPINKIDKPLTLQEFKSLKIHKYMEPMTFEDLVKLMSIHKDMYIITDTKETDKNVIKEQFTKIVETTKKYDTNILKRIIPQFYNEDMYYEIKGIYNFDSYIYTLYMTNTSNEQVINFMVENGLKVVTMSPYRISKEFVAELNEKGIFTYTHTINSMLDVKTYQGIGIHGFYTDYITPDYYTKESYNKISN